MSAAPQLPPPGPLPVRVTTDRDQPEVEARVSLQWRHIVAILGALGIGSGGALALRSAPPVVVPSIDPVALEHRLTNMEAADRYILLKLDELLRRTPPHTVEP